MKNLIVMLGVSLTVLLPFSLRADEEELSCDHCHQESFCVPCCSFDTKADFSDVLGNQFFVDYLYEFFDRFADLCVGYEVEARQLIALYPEEPVSISYEREMNILRDILENRDANIKMMAFVWMGIYPQSAYTDDETLSQFKELQNLILFGLIKDLMVYGAYDAKEISEETYNERFAEIEKEIMTHIKALCLASKDAFFIKDMPDFLGDSDSRLEAAKRFFSFEDENDFDGGETQAEMAFEDLDNRFSDQVDELKTDMFSFHAIQELSQKLVLETDVELDVEIDVKMDTETEISEPPQQ